MANAERRVRQHLNGAQLAVPPVVVLASRGEGLAALTDGEVQDCKDHDSDRYDVAHCPEAQHLKQ